MVDHSCNNLTQSSSHNPEAIRQTRKAVRIQVFRRAEIMTPKRTVLGSAPAPPGELFRNQTMLSTKSANIQAPHPGQESSELMMRSIISVERPCLALRFISRRLPTKPTHFRHGRSKQSVPLA